MTIDYRAYNDPGVYFDQADAPVVAAPAVSPTVIALIGDSRRGQETTEIATVVTTFGPTTNVPTNLVHKGIDLSSITIQDATTGIVYAISSPINSGAPTTLGDIRVMQTGTDFLATITSVQREPRTVASATIAAGVATYTANNHGFQVGDQVTIEGMLEANYNTRLTITAVTTNTFSGLVSPAPAGASTQAGIACRVANGAQILVTFRYANADYYTPQAFTDFQTFQQTYGGPWDATGVSAGQPANLVSPLALAAQLAFANGASQVVALAVKPSSLVASLTQQNWYDAIDLLGTEQEVNTVVPVLGNMTGTGATAQPTFIYLRNALNAWANAGQMVVGFIGLDGSAAVDDMTPTAQAQAALLNSTRMAIFAPAVTQVMTSTGVPLNVGGQYLAAAAAGTYASDSPARPITHRQMVNLFDFPDEPTKAIAVTAQSKGVAVCSKQVRQGATTFRINHGVTTQQNPNVYTREISIQAASDRLHDLLYDTLTNSEVIGGINDSAAPDVVVATVSSALETAVTQDLIQGYGNVAYQVPTDGPTTILVRFSYQPSLPLNVIIVQFSIDTTSGNVTNLEEVAA